MIAAPRGGDRMILPTPGLAGNNAAPVPVVAFRAAGNFRKSCCLSTLKEAYRMRCKLFSAGLVLALGAGFSLTAYSQAKPETMVKQRQAAMTLQLKYLGPLFAMAQGKAPFDAQTVARNAGYLDVLDKMAWDGFNRHDSHYIGRYTTT